jgi:glycosyltransferase involved in cell wall biosynthesis
MFSIVIPLYNKAAYIEKAVLSVLNQSCKEFQLIVVDDGSQDNGLGIVNMLIATHTSPSGGWRVITQENQGVSIARNNGVKVAKYDYIAFLDADDWWEPTFLEEMKNLIGEFPDAGIYGCSYFKVKNGMTTQVGIGVESGFERGLINYFKVYARTMAMPLTSITVVIPKRIFEYEKGFKANLKFGEDFNLWVHIAAKYSVVLLNKPLAYYNQDVVIQNRAAGGQLYEPTEHFIFEDYRQLKDNPDFRFLFEELALYVLLPLYLADKNKSEVNDLLKTINWRIHPFKYRFYYRFLPKTIVSFWLKFICFGATVKKKLQQYEN